MMETTGLKGFNQILWTFYNLKYYLNLSILQLSWSTRNRCSQMFFKIGALKNSRVFMGKHLYWSLFLIKIAGLQVCNFIKKRLQYRCFPVNISKFSRAVFFIERIRCLLWGKGYLGLFPGTGTNLGLREYVLCLQVFLTKFN